MLGFPFSFLPFPAPICLIAVPHSTIKSPVCANLSCKCVCVHGKVFMHCRQFLTVKCVVSNPPSPHHLQDFTTLPRQLVVPSFQIGAGKPCNSCLRELALAVLRSWGRPSFWQLLKVLHAPLSLSLLNTVPPPPPHKAATGVKEMGESVGRLFCSPPQGSVLQEMRNKESLL